MIFDKYGKKENQLDQRGNTFWGPIELVRRPYSVVDASSTDFFRHSQIIADFIPW
jgi:hypothetical protein